MVLHVGYLGSGKELSECLQREALGQALLQRLRQLRNDAETQRTQLEAWDKGAGSVFKVFLDLDDCSRRSGLCQSAFLDNAFLRVFVCTSLTFISSGSILSIQYLLFLPATATLIRRHRDELLPTAPAKARALLGLTAEVTTRVVALLSCEAVPSRTESYLFANWRWMRHAKAALRKRSWHPTHWTQVAKLQFGYNPAAQGGG